MLESTLTVEPTDDGLTLRLSVENVGEEPVELSFPDAQRAEFTAHDADGTEVWRWSDGRMFAMALGSLALDPGEVSTFEAEWPDPPAGEHRVRGWLTADGADAAAELSVVVE